MTEDKMNENHSQTQSDDQIWHFLVDALVEGEVEVLFEKENGTMREMVCTLNKDFIDYEFKEGQQPDAANEIPAKDRDVLTVWDTENQGWRKLTKGRIETVNLLGESDEAA